MQFRLIYEGRLAAASRSDSRHRDKHPMRRVFHKQLRELWNRHAFLRRFHEGHINKQMPDGSKQRVTVAYEMTCNFSISGFRFLPLVRESLGVGCSLDILFLRRDEPGGLIKSGGDIDNRMKVLLDALRVPKSEEVNAYAPDPDEEPFYCLLEDDRLVTELKIKTDRLLNPVMNHESIHDVYLVIKVKTVVFDEDKAWSVFR